MSDIQPPKRRQNRYLPDNARPQVADNMASEKMIQVSFNMPEIWHRRFKTAAAQSGKSMKEILMESFELWERNQK